MGGIFITGCGTDIGKTIISTLFLKCAQDMGLNATVFKPIQTGCIATIGANGESRMLLPDLEFICDTCCDSEEEADKLRQNYTYKYLPTCSPHLAANLSDSPDISISQMYCDIKDAEKNHDLVIVEGAGGLMVPFNSNETFRDLAVMLQYETVIITNNRLGCINETLLTVEALTNKELPPLGIIMNNTTPATEQDNYIRRDNPEIISSCTGVPVLSEVPYTADLTCNNTEFWTENSKKLSSAIRHVMSIERV